MLGHRAVVQILLYYYSACLSYIPSSGIFLQQKTALPWAFGTGPCGILFLLLQKGASPTAKKIVSNLFSFFVLQKQVLSFASLFWNIRYKTFYGPPRQVFSLLKRIFLFEKSIEMFYTICEKNLALIKVVLLIVCLLVVLWSSNWVFIGQKLLLIEPFFSNGFTRDYSRTDLKISIDLAN